MGQQEWRAMDTQAWLKASKGALLAAGFHRSARQLHKPGQVWGLIRQEPEDMQFHVRGYKDGRLEAEMELSNKYVQHLWSQRSNAALALMDILEAAGLPSDRVVQDFAPGREDQEMPTGRTSVSLVAAGIVTLAAGAALWALLRRK